MTLPSKPLRLLFLAGAGVSTFYVGARLAIGSHDAAAGAVVEPVTRPHAAPAAGAASAPTPEAMPGTEARERSIPRTKGDPFKHFSWLPPPPPPPPPPAPAPPPKPAAPVTPPLPFTFVGMLERGNAKPEAFLAKGDALLVVSVGDLLDNNTYRVDALNPNEVVLTHLPTNVQQTLNVSGTTK